MRKAKFKISLMDLPGQYQLIKQQVLPEVKRVLASARYIQGPEVGQFEEEFAKYCNAKFCIGTSSGTESLILALRALGIGPHDEVVTVPNTFTATAEAIWLVGAKIVFCDINPKTFNMDPTSLEKKITKHTKAVIPVHLHGNPVDMDGIFKITKPQKIHVIEDASQAHGAIYKSQIIGSLKSDLTVFSFHPVKNLGGCGDGGAVVTNNSKIAKTIRMLINHGRSGHHQHMIIGTTGRLDTLQAAVLLTKLRLLDDWNNQKKFWANYYKQNLSTTLQLTETLPGCESAYHVFAIFVKNRRSLKIYLESNGIETGMHYPHALHLQPAYRFLGYKVGDFPVTEYFAKHTLSVPLFAHMTKSQTDYVIDKIKGFK